WRHALALVVAVLLKSPFLTLSIIALTIFGQWPIAEANLQTDMSHVAVVFRVLQTFATWAAKWLTVAVMCRIVKARWSEISGEQWTPSFSDLARFPSALANFYIYNFVVWAGLCALVAPGIIGAARGCLSLAVICIE